MKSLTEGSIYSRSDVKVPRVRSDFLITFFPMQAQCSSHQQRLHTGFVSVLSAVGRENEDILTGNERLIQ